MSSKSINSTILENRVGFKHEQDNPYKYPSKPKALPSLVKNNFVNKSLEKARGLSRTLQNDSENMKTDMIYHTNNNPIEDSIESYVDSKF